MPKIKLNLLFNIRRLVIPSTYCSGKISGPKINFRAYFTPLLSILILPMVLSACNSLPVETAVEDNAGVSNQASSEIPAGAHESEINQANKQSKLDGDSLYNLLAAEFAGNIGDIETSLKHYRLAAKSIEDSRIAARTAYIALYGEHYDEALVALDRWRELEPG